MAQQQPQGRPRNEIGFQEIELLKEETLGVGSYGSVCMARCDHLLCAAKIIHPTLVPPNALQQISPQREHRLPIRRFETECDFLRDIKHPNIIQYLGMYQDPETGLPVLLMELMDESLTHFLESSTEPIPYQIQLTISLDVVQALSFLHLNGIIHRDLSSNNILLIGKGRAKLTDFGMAKLVDVHRSHVSNTMCPGTDAYMPPETIGNQAVYTAKGDVFSFGVNIVQILTRKFPKPGDRFKTLQIDHPQVPSGRVQVRVSEIERRSNDISEINQAHPLILIAHDCLKDQKGERPSAGELCQRLAALKDTPEYTESERAVEGRRTTQHTTLAERDRHVTEPLQQLTSQQQEKDEQIQQYQQALTARQQEIQYLREELSTAQATVREKVQIIATRDQQQRNHEEMIAQFQRRIEQLELNSRPQPRAQSLSSSSIAKITPLIQYSRSRGHQPAQHPPFTSREEGVIRLNWTQGRKAPCKMSKSVVNGSVPYFRPDGTRQVYSYISTTDTWSRLPDCPIKYTTLAVVNGLLTSVGGLNSNKLFSLTGEGRSRKWTEIFPPMITERDRATAVTTGRAFIVVGGSLTTVEIMNIETRQWSTAADIPQGMWSASATVCSDRVYMSQGELVITCSLPVLLQSCHPPIFESQLTKPSPQGPIWSTVADLPVKESTLVSINNHLLAIGGYDSYYKPSTAARLYDQVNNSWQTISHLSTPRERCFAVVLPNNRIMVAGGFTTESLSSKTDTVEFGDVVNF